MKLEKKVMYTLWVLANCETLLACSERFDLDINTGNSIIEEIVFILNEMIGDYIKWPTESQSTENARVSGRRFSVLFVINKSPKCYSLLIIIFYLLDI